MCRYIAVSPSNGSFGFNVKFDMDQITIPGYDVGYRDFFQDDMDEKSELRFILEEDFGCTYQQINDIKYFILHHLNGEVDSNGLYLCD